MLLDNFPEKEKNVIISKSYKKEDFVTNELTHYWNDNLVWKVAEFKNKIIRTAYEDLIFFS